jgi:hypothetical protein
VGAPAASFPGASSSSQVPQQISLVRVGEYAGNQSSVVSIDYDVTRNEKDMDIPLEDCFIYLAQK